MFVFLNGCSKSQHGEKRLPPTVWSATPLFVNDTLYVGTPFYRIFALEPDTGGARGRHDGLGLGRVDGSVGRLRHRGRAARR